MTGRTPHQVGPRDAVLEKKAAEKRRLASALRANLRRRKASTSRGPMDDRPAAGDTGEGA